MPRRRLVPVLGIAALASTACLIGAARALPRQGAGAAEPIDAAERCRLEAAEFQKAHTRLREADQRLQEIYFRTKHATDDAGKVRGLVELAGALLDERRTTLDEYDALHTRLTVHLLAHGGVSDGVAQMREGCPVAHEVAGLREQSAPEAVKRSKPGDPVSPAPSAPETPRGGG